MDGLLVIDKPSGPTSHDVVARVRRLMHEPRVGHTGTLDPMASGVLPLVIGRATRLARFLSAGDKTYAATLRLGFSTDTCDAQGHQVGPACEGPWPDRARIDAALDAFRGTFLQQPPAFSAKKIDGRRSYDLARRARGPARGPASGLADTAPESPASVVALPNPVSVTAHAVDLLGVDGPMVRLRVVCSAGFYIRSLAHDLGMALGTGAHLTALRRTESAGVTVDAAVPLATLETAGVDAARLALIPMEAMLGGMIAVTLTPDAVKRTLSGRDVGPGDAAAGFDEAGAAAHVRLLDPEGRLVAIAEPSPSSGLLHPAVVLM